MKTGEREKGNEDEKGANDAGGTVRRNTGLQKFGKQKWAASKTHSKIDSTFACGNAEEREGKSGWDRGLTQGYKGRKPKPTVAPPSLLQRVANHYVLCLAKEG